MSPLILYEAKDLEEVASFNPLLPNVPEREHLVKIMILI